ncbi:MAG: hypothetical protein HKN33_12290 [Pyrinomonadaceae bacterium]|nr:hypothetical protein [Pyrinomonadaceae bacterium]
MRVKIGIIMICVIASACGMMGGGSGISVGYDGSSGSVSPTSTAMLVDTVGDSSSDKKMVSHTFVIANYELDEKLTKMKLQGSAKEDGRMRVEITIIGAKGTDKETAVKPGEYTAREGNVGSPENSVNGGRIAYSEDGKEKRVYVGGADMKAGKVTIDSVSGDTISGEVDISAGDNYIKGKFTAKTK